MKKKILHHTSIMIIFAVLVTFLAASVVTYNKLNTYMQRRGLRIVENGSVFTDESHTT